MSTCQAVAGNTIILNLWECLELMETGLCSSWLMFCPEVSPFRNWFIWKWGFPRERDRKIVWWAGTKCTILYFKEIIVVSVLIWCGKFVRNWIGGHGRSNDDCFHHTIQETYCVPQGQRLQKEQGRNIEKEFESWSVKQLEKSYAQNKQGHYFLWRTI